MSRQHEDAHYLHQRRGLSVLVRPPVEDAVVLAWDGRSNLLVGTEEGLVQRVHPAMGTRTLMKDLDEPIGIGVSDDRFVLVEEGGRWGTYDLDGRRIIEAEHPFTGPVDVQFREGKVLLTGPTPSGKQLLFYDSGRKVLRIQLPEPAVPFVASGYLGLAQSTPIGLEVIYMRDNGRFHGTEFTPHVLRAYEDYILGTHAGGVRVWDLTEGEHVDVSLAGTVSTTLSHDGHLVALGTADGKVAVAALHSAEARASPVVVEATDEPIRAIAFSRKGKYLASGGEDVIVWTWE